ncbi:epoxide hydrolase family protein [Sodalis ligni]|jgi:pimeloyl-ACP methyl ester carboxylesterase|uniref:Pimeloyl-ACP methyl ester carboxylesterase n=1 Tax=Sodalis ligni TaxID=2697027 RepID=A0A4R1NBZ8_9GAMM|nr:epoxide hydrolase family protein [Sodalis ligni]TCL05014.1 pimeloyl-ACP methyl ester carboxylesterase [Sodalis ligni]
MLDFIDPMKSAPGQTEFLSPFTIAIPEAVLEDLKRRLDATRLPEQETVPDASQGPRLARIKELIEYWKTEYDWRRVEKRLNQYPQFKTGIDGLGIHFLHVRSRHPNAMPLILTHGWPGSVIEFLDIIDSLVDPIAHGGKAEDAFHLVIPSLPGYGFSDKPEDKGWNRNRIAKAWHALMRRLGYDQYVAQGGDWGSHVTIEMARLQLPGLKAIHTNLPLVTPRDKPAYPTPDEQRAFDQLARFGTDGSGYYWQMVTRPQTIGYALADSPVGLLSWIYDKFESWTDSNGDPVSVLGYDKILDDITLYWVTNTGASSARMYAEHPDLDFYAIPVHIPVGVSVFPGEIWTPPESWARQTYPNLVYWNKTSRGGHFAAFEQPVLFADEVRKAFRSIRN